MVCVGAVVMQVVEELATDTDYVWIHDYHLLVLPSLLRKRFNRIRCGLFLHSPFPSSEIFRQVGGYWSMTPSNGC